MGIDGSQIKRRKDRLTELMETKKIATPPSQASQPPPSKPVKHRRLAPKLPRIDCGACKADGAMNATKTPRFGGFIRFIGYVFVIPSVLGISFAVLMFFSTGVATSDMMSQSLDSASQAGMAIGSAMGFGFSLFLGASSLVGGLVGYLLLTKKKVFRCKICGYILDRA